ncbi:hypothetical protein WJX81_001379 [Elliptochloris bilobata]|uniref:Uncharacterized protein n=1 Tax=Elliptochloris bilobata TaxID=381761 RepID=A0AAW1RT52_9CHLO
MIQARLSTSYPSASTKERRDALNISLLVIALRKVAEQVPACTHHLRRRRRGGTAARSSRLFDGSCLMRWFEHGGRTCPATGLPLPDQSRPTLGGGLARD